MATEKRLIDANALPSGWMLAKFTEINGEMRLRRTMPLSACPTVDAVEVVRCKDCKQWGGVVYGGRCKHWSAPLSGITYFTCADDFCSYGERRTDNERKAD